MWPARGVRHTIQWLTIPPGFSVVKGRLWADGDRPSGDLNPIMMQPGTTYNDKHGRYFQVVDTTLLAQPAWVQSVRVVNQPTALAGVPDRHLMDPKFAMREFI